MLFYEKVQQKKDAMSGQASGNNMLTKEAAAVSTKNKEHTININTRRNLNTSKRLCLSLSKKRKAVFPQISMSTTVGCATDSFSSSETLVTAELKKEEPLHTPSPTPTPTSNLNISMSPSTPAQMQSAAGRTPPSSSETITTSPGTKIDVSTIPSPPLKMSGCDDNLTDDVVQ